MVTHPSSCPCVRCNDARSPLWWLDARAEKQIVTKAEGAEGFAAAEAREVAAFSAGVKRDIDKILAEVLSTIAAAGATSIPVTQDIVQRVLGTLEAKMGAVIDAIKSTATPYAQSIAAAGFETGATMLPQGSLNLAIFTSGASPAVLASTARTAERMAKVVARTVADRIAEIMKIGLEGNMNGKTIMTLLTEEGFSETRAQTIARTESSRAYNEGQKAAWKESGLVEGTTWVVSPYACEFCQEVGRKFETQSTPLDGSFFDVGAVVTAPSGRTLTIGFDKITSPPLHPNCRCGEQPVLIKG